MGTEVRIGMVGVGGMGQSHLESLAKIPEARVVALCDAVEERARSVAEPLGAAIYTDAARLIAEADLEALYVCVPPYLHDSLEIRAAEKGLHLYVEKPVNLSLDGARDAWQAIQKAGVLVQTGYQLRYQPPIRQLKSFLADKRVGTAHVTRWSGQPGSDWWRRYDRSGGQLVEMATHQVDLLRYVLGEVKTVSAGYSFNRLFQEQPETTIPDSQAVLLRFVSGAWATLNVSCALGQTGRGEVRFVIPDAQVSLGGDGITLDPPGLYALPPLPGDGLNADEAFVRAVATGDRSLLLSPYDDGLRSLAATLAANQSAANGGALVRMTDLLGPLAGPGQQGIGAANGA